MVRVCVFLGGVCVCVCVCVAGCVLAMSVCKAAVFSGHVLVSPTVANRGACFGVDLERDDT